MEYQGGVVVKYQGEGIVVEYMGSCCGIYGGGVVEYLEGGSC